MWVVHVCRPASMRKRDECGPRNVRAELFFPGWPRGRQRLTKPYQLPLIIIRSLGRNSSRAFTSPILLASCSCRDKTMRY